MSTRLAESRVESIPAWRLLDDVQLLELPDPEFLVDRVIPRRSVGVLYSPPGSGKTTLAASLAVSVATGRPWYGHSVCHRGAAVYVGAEDPAGFKIRLRAAKLAERLPLDEAIGVYTFPEALDLRDSVSVSRFTAFLDRSFDSHDLERELLIVDTYAAVTPGSAENSSEDMTVSMAHAQQWRDRLGLTVLIVHHMNASGSRERGHSSMRGASDFMISMTPVDDAVTIECSKQRNAAPFEPLTLKLVPIDGGGCVFRRAADVLPTVTLTPTQAKVYEVLRDTFSDDGASKSEWQRSCADVADRSFHRSCKVLIEAGYVRNLNSRFSLTAKAPVLR